MWHDPIKKNICKLSVSFHGGPFLCQLRYLHPYNIPRFQAAIERALAEEIRPKRLVTSGFCYPTREVGSFIHVFDILSGIIAGYRFNNCRVNGCAYIYSRLKPTIDNDFPPWSRTSGDFLFKRALNFVKNDISLSDQHPKAIITKRPGFYQ